MHFLKTTLIFSLSLFSFAAFPQSAPMKFGKVPEEDLKMTVYDLDTTAAAVILGDYGNLNFFFATDDVSYRFERHTRIKILKRSGFDKGDINIPYYSKNRFENIKAIKVKVFAPDGTVTEINRGEIFDEEVNEYWSRKRFTCPNLQIGSVIDYEYDTECKSIFQLPTWYFQSDIPVRWSEMRMEIPEWYDYIMVNQGRPLDIFEKDKGKKNYYVSAAFGGSGKMDVKTNLTRMATKDVPALKEESYITNMEDYYARMRFQLSSVTYSDGVYRQVMSTWEKLAQELKVDDNFGEQLSKKRNYDDVMEAAASSVPKDGTVDEKVGAIYNFLLSNIEVNSSGSIFTAGKLNDCFEKKSARAGEMNLLMIALLREYGVEAHPLLISTRSNGKPMPIYPLVNQFDHVMALVSTGDQYIVVDASNPFRPPGYPAYNSLNGQGFALIEGSPQWIDIPTPSGGDTYLLNFTLSPEGHAEGQFTMSCDGYSAISERQSLHSNPSGDYLQKRLAKKFPDATLDSVSFENQNELSQPFKARAQIKIPSVAMSSGDFIYLTPSILSNFDETPFKLETRLYPVDIPHPFKEQIIVNITLPEGFAVEDLPEPVRMSLPDNAGLFQYQLTQNFNKVQLVSKLQINNLHYEPEEYIGLRNFFSLVEEKIGEQVVLKRQ